MGVIFRAFGWVLGLFVLLGAGLLVASELQEVVVLTSRDDGGRAVETRLWIVDAAGQPWLRSGARERGWFQRVSKHPDITLSRDGQERGYRAVVVDVPEVRMHVDQLMREKYGLTDALIRFLEGDPESVPVRLQSLPGGF